MDSETLLCRLCARERREYQSLRVVACVGAGWAVPNIRTVSAEIRSILALRLQGEGLSIGRSKMSDATNELHRKVRRGCWIGAGCVEDSGGARLRCSCL